MQVIDDLLGRVPSAPLFHYTSAQGLLGILQSGNIYASSAYHQNDAKEFHYAIDLVLQQLQMRIRAERGPWNEMYGNLLGEFDSIRTSAQVFIASFSEQGDLLSQWLTYSGQSNGYAVAFSAEHFNHARTNGFSLVKCVYDRQAQEALANAAIDAICVANRKPTEVAVIKVLTTAAAMKHPGFEHEAEWRLIKPLWVHQYASGRVHFREGRCGLVPYLTAPLVSSGEMLLPSLIHVGPGADMHAAQTSLSTFLYARGLNTWPAPTRVEVVASRTPYRP